MDGTRTVPLVVMIVPMLLLASVLWLWHSVDTSGCEQRSSPCLVAEDQRSGADPLAPLPVVP